MKIVGYIKGRKPASLFADNKENPTSFYHTQEYPAWENERAIFEKMDKTPIVSIKFKILTKWYGRISSGYSMAIEDIETGKKFKIANENIVKTILYVQEGHFKLVDDYFVGFFKPVTRNRVIYFEPQNLEALQKMDREF